MARGPEVSPAVAVAVLALLLGGAGGYYARYFMESPNDAPKPVAVYGDGNIPAPSAPSMGGGGGMGGGRGGGAQSGAALARLVRSLSTLQNLQGKGLSPEALKALLPTLNRIKAADKISEADAKSLLAEIQKAAEPAKEALASLSPQRGGGMGGGMMGGGGMSSGSRPPGIPGPGGGIGGPQSDPEKPFASERNKAALDELLKLSGG
jgi:hypothetical protein